MNIDDVKWCIANADNLSLRRFAEQFKYTNKHSANRRYRHILSSAAFKECQNNAQLLNEFNAWKGSLEEVTFWGEDAINQEKLAADYTLRSEGLKTAKQYGVEANEVLRDSIRRRRSMGDIDNEQFKRLKTNHTTDTNAPAAHAPSSNAPSTNALTTNDPVTNAPATNAPAANAPATNTSATNTPQQAENVLDWNILFNDEQLFSSQQSAPAAIHTTIRTVWDQWVDFLRAAELEEDTHDYRAEKHGVIVCGDRIIPESRIPADAYKKTVRLLGGQKPRNIEDFFALELDMIDTVLDAPQGDMLQKARELALASGSCRPSCVTFLSDIFINVIREIFVTETKLNHSEAAFNEAAVWPVLKFAVYSMNQNNRGLKFYPGEDRLRSMSVQLEANKLSADNRSCYKADAILRCSERYHEMEVLLLETSNSYNSADQPKISFDFHKGLFGALSMLKTIADHHRYADFKVMAKLRVYFAHAHTKHIRLWSISYPGQGVFVVYREDKCAIPTSFHDDQKMLLDYIRFTWALKDRLDSTMETLDELYSSNKRNMKMYRYKELPAEKDLSKIVEPSIVKITECVHKSIFAEDELYTSPNIPPSSKASPMVGSPLNT